MKLLLATAAVFALSLSSAFAETEKAWGPPPPAQWGKNNIHLIDRDDSTGFAIYRTSAPDADDMRRFCELGITEMVVLSGDAAKHEAKFAKDCPTLRVIYNTEQSTTTPLDTTFLRFFDDWVQDAQAKGKKIAFRCQCGCHRTGRLAAYYQMRYQGLTLSDAKAVLNKNGFWMAFFPQIAKQVDALADYVEGRACTTKPKYCVQD